MEIRKLPINTEVMHRSKADRRTWPYPKLNRETVLGLGLALLAFCLYPFWGTIAVAAIFAFGLKKPLTTIRSNLRLGRTLSVVMAVVVLLLALLLPATYLGLRLYQVAAEKGRTGSDGIFSAATTERIANAYQRIEEGVATYGQKFRYYQSTADARQSIRQNLAKLGKTGIEWFTTALLGIPDLVVSLFLFSLFLYLFLSKGVEIGAGFTRIGILPQADLQALVSTFQKSCRDAIVISIAIGVVQATVVAVGARLSGYREFAVIFTITFFLSFIPIIGAGPVGFFLSAVSFLTGNSAAGIALLATGLVAGSIDNILRPYLISNKNNEGHPILSLATIIGAIMIFGLKGLILGPVILTVTFSLLKKQPAQKS